MDKKVEEIIKKKSRTGSNDFKELFRQDVPSAGEIEVRDDVVIKARPCQFPTCPIIDVGEGHYFYTVDGRTLIFRPGQKSPYIFLPFPLCRAIFHSSGGRMYFVTLDSSNKLQYSVLADGYPSEERHIISRNVTQVIQQENRIFYVSTKNEFQHVNTVWDDNGALRGRMYVPNIKAEQKLSIFYANSALFMNIDMQFQREDGKKLQVQGDQICGMGSGFLVLETKKREAVVFLLDEKYVVVDQMKMPTVGGTVTLTPLGSVVGVRVDDVIYIVGALDGKLRIEKVAKMDSSPLALSMSLEGQTLRISRIAPSEADVVKESAVEVPSCGGEIVDDVSSMSLKGGLGETCTMKDNEIHRGQEAEKLWDTEPGDEFLRPSDKDDGGMSGHSGECVEKSTVDRERESVPEFEPYSPNRDDAGDMESMHVRTMVRMLREMEDRIRRMESMQDERLRKMSEMVSGIGETQILTAVRESVRKEVSRIHEGMREMEPRGKDGMTSESRVLEFVKKVILGTLVPAVEASMDEMRIQVVNEIRLIHSEDHLKGVKKAVDNLHSSFNKKNEVKSLISRGMIEKAAEVALKGPDTHLETFISSVEISCLETLPSSVLIGLLEKVMVMVKDNLKPQYQSFLYMVMVCLDLEELNDEEIQVLEILISYISNIEGLELNDNKGLAVILDFQKLKLGKVKNKRGIK